MVLTELLSDRPDRTECVSEPALSSDIKVDRCASLNGDCDMEGLVADCTGGVAEGLGAAGNGAEFGGDAAGSVDGNVGACSLVTIIVFLLPSRRPRMVPWLRRGAADYELLVHDIHNNVVLKALPPFEEYL